MLSWFFLYFDSLFLLLFFQAHNTRRVNLLSSSMKQKKDKEVAQQEVWEKRFKVRDHEAQRKKHEDSLKFFQVSCSELKISENWSKKAFIKRKKII